MPCACPINQEINFAEIYTTLNKNLFVGTMPCACPINQEINFAEIYTTLNKNLFVGTMPCACPKHSFTCSLLTCSLLRSKTLWSSVFLYGELKSSLLKLPFVKVRCCSLLKLPFVPARHKKSNLYLYMRPKSAFSKNIFHSFCKQPPRASLDAIIF